MKKFLKWGAIFFFGLIVISALLDEKDKAPQPTQEARQGDSSVMPDEKDKPINPHSRLGKSLHSLCLILPHSKRSFWLS